MRHPARRSRRCSSAGPVLREPQHSAPPRRSQDRRTEPGKHVRQRCDRCGLGDDLKRRRTALLRSNTNYLEANLTNAAGATVEVKSGELRQDENTTTTNEGAFKVATGAIFAATASGDLFVNKGSLANSGSSSLTSNASWTQEAGTATQSGNPVSIFNSGTLTDVSGAGSFDLLDTAVLSGTIPKGQTVTAEALPSHNALVQISGTVTNEGTLALESPSKGGEPGLVGASLQVRNEGVLTAASASTSATFLETGLTNAAGATVEVKSGELRQDENTTTTNEGTFKVATGASFAATASNDLFINDAKSPNGVVASGTIQLTSNASWTQNGAETGNPVSIFNSGKLTDEGGEGGFDLLDTAVLSGTIPKGQTVTADAIPSHNAEVKISGTVTNEGTLALDSPAGGGLPDIEKSSSSSQVNNDGLLTAQSETSQSGRLEVALSNEASGTVEVKSGELRQDANTTTTNTGSFDVLGAATFAATTSGDLFVNKGSLANSGSSSLTSNASWTQEAGTATQSGNPVSIFNSGTLTDVSGEGSFDLIDTAVLSGTIPKGQTVIAQALPSHNALVTILGTVTNEGTLALESPSKGGEPGLVGTALQVKNKGVLTAASASSSAMFLETGLTNAAGATVEVKTGELRQDDNTTTTNEGTFVIARCGIFQATAGDDLFVNKGVLSNVGT